jgi:hypothetical protein
MPCDFCGYETEEIELRTRVPGYGKLMNLCSMCRSKPILQDIELVRMTEIERIMRHISHCANIILEEMKHGKKKK